MTTRLHPMLDYIYVYLYTSILSTFSVKDILSLFFTFSVQHNIYADRKTIVIFYGFSFSYEVKHTLLTCCCNCRFWFLRCYHAYVIILFLLKHTWTRINWQKRLCFNFSGSTKGCLGILHRSRNNIFTSRLRFISILYSEGEYTDSQPKCRNNNISIKSKLVPNRYYLNSSIQLRWIKHKLR